VPTPSRLLSRLLSRLISLRRLYRFFLLRLRRSLISLISRIPLILKLPLLVLRQTSIAYPFYVFIVIACDRARFALLVALGVVGHVLVDHEVFVFAALVVIVDSERHCGVCGC
jgi:hypothetical protein